MQETTEVYPDDIYVCGSLFEAVTPEARGWLQGVFDKVREFERGSWVRFDRDTPHLDFEGLEGKRVELRHEDGTVIRGKLVRDEWYAADTAYGWDICGVRTVNEFVDAWANTDSKWSIWVEGELPTKKLFASEIPFATKFQGFHVDDESSVQEYVRVAHDCVQKVSGEDSVAMPADKFVVLKCLGRFV